MLRVMGSPYALILPVSTLLSMQSRDLIGLAARRRRLIPSRDGSSNARTV